MDKLREAARQALKDWDKRNPLDEAMNLMEEALAEQAEQKPVAIDELARACNLAGIEYKDFLRIKAHLPIVAPVQQVEQEPVAWWNGKETAWFEHELCGWQAPDGCTIPLYAAPVQREWVDLSNDEIDELIRKWHSPDMGLLDFAWAVIAAFKEKNK